jgi:hypothetical protein
MPLRQITGKTEMAIPGLPALASNVIVQTVQLIAADVLSILGAADGPQWGLFQDGLPVVTADNVLSFEFRQDFRISKYPVEEGAFESYNKVTVPFDVRLQFSTGGSIAKRQALIDSVDAIIDSTDLFDAVTTEKTYLSVNPVHQSMRRTGHAGAGLVIIDLYCEQIRVTTSQQFANSQQGATTTTTGNGNLPNVFVKPGNDTINQPKSPSAAPQVSDGTVQTTPAAPGQFDLSQALP